MPIVSPLNVFTPATEIDDVHRFAGRATELQAVARALESDGVQLVIYGNRGIGKSSLARLTERIATGDKPTLSRLRSRPGKELDFVTFFFRCDDSITSIPKLLHRLLTDEGALGAWAPLRVVSRETKTEGKGKIDLKLVSVGGAVGEAVTEAAPAMETDVVSVFISAAKKIVDYGLAADGLLIIIDEFDRIRDRSGLASLLKTLGPQHVKFVLVGVATTVQELITEHESVARQLADGSVHVPPMSSGEIDEIFNLAESLLNDRPGS